MSPIPRPFLKGQRVQLTEAGRKVLAPRLERAHTLQRANYESGGTVTGGGDRGCIRIRVDGVKSAQTYHASFWEPVP